MRWFFNRDQRRLRLCTRTTALFALSSLLALIGCEKVSVAPKQAKTITVFAAASTVDVLNEAARLFKAEASVEVKCSFDASSTLAKQIINGAPADVFLSADQKWMDEAARAGTIDAASRRDLLGNQLVLIVPKGKALTVRMETGFDIAGVLPPNARLALADPTHVPAGIYAKQSLEHLGWWSGVEKLVIPAQDVRSALRLVERGEADAGIVYSTDAKASKDIAVVAEFPPESHEPVRYPIALVKGAKPQAADFIAFLQGEEMKRIFSDAGFVVLTEQGGR